MIKRNLRIVFMGTPDFAVPSLQFLMEAGYPIMAVITAPDKPGGRGMKTIISSAVKKYALDNGLNVMQPTNLKSKVFLSELEKLRPDLQVVVAFRMLPEAVWSLPSRGTLNLHGSLLPAYRGAAPIQWAIIRGEQTTGITTFLLQQEIDTGAVLLQREIPILYEDDGGNVHDRMMHAGAGLVLASVDLIQSGHFKPHPQEELKASHAPKIHHADGRLDWHQRVEEIYNLIRGLSPFPGAWSRIDGTEIKIWKSRVHSFSMKSEPGTLRLVGKDLVAQALDGELNLLEVQMAGKKKMSAREWLNGYTVKDWTMT